MPDKKLCRICWKSSPIMSFKNTQYVCGECRKQREQQNKIRNNISSTIHNKLFNCASFSINDYLPYSMHSLLIVDNY